MAKLTGQTIASSYDQLLIVDNADGISATLQSIESGDTGGSSSALQIATNKILAKPGSDDANAFEVQQSDGTAILTVDSSTPAVSFNDNNITNVGDISLDSISSDAGTSINVVLGSDAGDDFTVDTDKLVVEGDTGNVGIGTTSPAGSSTKVLDIENTTTSSATEGGNIRLGSNDGAVMASGHRLGVLEFAGAEDASNTMTVGARIEALADATWSDSENGADLLFYTTDGDASQSEQMRITADGTQNQQGNYILNEQGRQDHVANTMSSPYYRFDGSDDYIDITSVSNAATGVRDLTKGYVEALFRTGTDTTSIHIVCFGATGGNTRNHMICTDGNSKLYIDLEIDNVNKYRATGGTTLQAHTTYHVVFVHNGTTPKVYLNGVEETLTFSITADKTAWNDSQGSWNKGSIGSNQSSNDPRVYYELEAVYRVRFGNHVPTDTEVKELYSGASVPFKYKGANQTELVSNGTFDSATTGWTAMNSATLTSIAGGVSGNCMKVYGSSTPWAYQEVTVEIGKRYRFECYAQREPGGQQTIIYIGSAAANGSDVFSDDDTPDDSSWHLITGDFTATTTSAYINVRNNGGTNEYSLFDSISLTQIGAVAEYDGSGASDTVWYDKSGNDLDGTVSGATLENKLDTIQTSGITFPETAHASSNANTLDDYEEGTVANAMKFGGVAVSSWQAGRDEICYTKIGQTVHVYGYLNAASGESETGDIEIVLPFEAGSDFHDGYGVGMAQHYENAKNYAIVVDRGASSAFLYDTGVNWAAANRIERASGEVNMRFSLTYRI